MVIHSDSCSLWRKSGHVEDEFSHKLVEFGLNCLSLTPTDIDFISADGDPAFRTSERLGTPHQSRRKWKCNLSPCFRELDPSPDLQEALLVWYSGSPIW